MYKLLMCWRRTAVGSEIGRSCVVRGVGLCLSQGPYIEESEAPRLRRGRGESNRPFSQGHLEKYCPDSAPGVRPCPPPTPRLFHAQSYKGEMCARTTGETINIEMLWRTWGQSPFMWHREDNCPTSEVKCEYDDTPFWFQGAKKWNDGFVQVLPFWFLRNVKINVSIWAYLHACRCSNEYFGRCRWSL